MEIPSVYIFDGPRKHVVDLLEQLLDVSNNPAIRRRRENPEHAGTCRNIPEHEKIKIIFMKKKI